MRKLQMNTLIDSDGMGAPMWKVVRRCSTIVCTYAQCFGVIALHVTVIVQTTSVLVSGDLYP